MALIKRYGNNKTATAFYPDGQGMVYYPSGNVAVAVTCPRGGGLSHSFYLDGQSKIVASFDNEGVGFVVYPESGAPMLSITKAGGCLTARDGHLMRKWLWKTQLKRLKFGSEPIECRINNAMTLSCRSRTKVVVKYELFVEMDFQVGLPDTKGGSETKSHGSSSSSSSSSSGGGGGHRNETILEKTQRLNYSLPRLSASGRETKAVLRLPPETLKRGIGDIVSIANELQTRLNSNALKSSITLNKELAEGAGDRIWRDRAAGKREKTIKFGSSYTSEYKQVPRTKDPLIRIRTLLPAQMLDTVDASSPSKMIIAVMTSDKYSESRPALKKTRWVATQVKKIWKEAEKNGVTYSFYEADCSKKNNVLVQRYNLTSYPVWLMWYGGKLLYAGSTFANFGVSKEEFVEHITTLVKNPGQHFKPEGWKFTTY